MTGRIVLTRLRLAGPRFRSYAWLCPRAFGRKGRRRASGRSRARPFFGLHSGTIEKRLAWRTVLPHFGAATASLITPSENGRIGPGGPKPCFAAVRTAGRRTIRNLVSTEEPLPAGKMPRFADDSRGRCRSGIGRGECADFILSGIVHVPDAGVSVGLVEYGRSAGFAARVEIAPMDPKKRETLLRELENRFQRLTELLRRQTADLPL